MRQLDLFQDNPATRALNQLRDALSARDVDRCRDALAWLSREQPGHEVESEARTLMEALEAPAPEAPAEGLRALESVEREWLPAAKRVLGPEDGRDFLAPLWRGAARAIESIPFNPACPERHASWAYHCGRDWSSARRSVLGVEGYDAHPVLLARLAEAEWRLGKRVRALDHWFTLGRRSPSAFEALMSKPDFPDEAIATAWRRAQDSDVEPAISPEWFPAWMLLEEPALAQPCESRQEQDAAGQALRVVRTLLTTHPDDPSNLPLRRELKTLHPGLLETFLRKYARP